MTTRSSIYIADKVALAPSAFDLAHPVEIPEGAEEFGKLITLPPLQDASQPFVVGFTGLGGRGKSAAMTLMVGLYRALIKEAAKRSKSKEPPARIYTNYINRWADFYDPDMLKYAIEGWLPNGVRVKGGLLALDELQQGGDKRRWNSRVNLALSNDLVGQLRKRPLHLAWSTQMAHHLESRVLERTNLFIMVNRRPWTHSYKFAVYDFNGIYTKPRKYRLPLTGDDATWYWRWEGNESVYRAYRHDQQITSMYTESMEEDYRNILHLEEEERLGERISNVRTFEAPPEAEGEDDGESPW